MPITIDRSRIVSGSSAVVDAGQSLQQKVPNLCGVPSWLPRITWLPRRLPLFRVARSASACSDFERGENTASSSSTISVGCPPLDRLEHAGRGHVARPDGLADDELGTSSTRVFPDRFSGETRACTASPAPPRSPSCA